MADDEKLIEVPNRAVSLTVVASQPINENWDAIEAGLNTSYEKALEVDERVPIADLGTPNGVATLDGTGKVQLTQMPQRAMNNVFECTTLAQQLTLNAVIGDICKRTDLGKTFALQTSDPTSFANWLEISSNEAGGEVGGNPPYTNVFRRDEWLGPNSDSNYYLVYSNSEHLQGETKFLFATVKNSLGETIYSTYNVDTDGTVTIFADATFEGSVMISNLEGNMDNSNLQILAINQGPVKADGSADILTNVSGGITIGTSPNVIYVDSLNVIRTISTANVTSLSGVANGIYVVFADSANITNNNLSQLTLIPINNYLGIVNKKPIEGEHGQRCYVAYDKGYEYNVDGWKEKAFIPLGYVQVSSETVYKLYSFPYNQNNINTNTLSTNKDYLFGLQKEGLQISGKTTILIKQGKVLDKDETEILRLKQDLTKTTTGWGYGQNAGCFIQQDMYEHTRTVYEVKDAAESAYWVSDSGEQYSNVESGVTIYADKNLTSAHDVSDGTNYTYTGVTDVVPYITDDVEWYQAYLGKNVFNEVDFMLSNKDVPTMPLGYTKYKRLGYIPSKNNELFKFNQMQDTIYFEPVLLINDDRTEYIANVSGMNCSEYIIHFYANNYDSINILTNDDLLIDVKNGVEWVVKVPQGSKFALSGTQAVKLELIGVKL